jgi:hypothetical protein
MATLTDEWVKHCLTLSRRKADFYSGCRKIHRCRTLTFENPFDQSLQMADCGFTSHKTRYLERNYIHEESREIATQLWDRRRGQAKYGSVGFSCYGHFIKGDPEKKSKRASVMGPCVTSVSITWLSKTEFALDMFYRTTELYKKFPADAVFFRDTLLKPFNFDGMTPVEMNCHFANITIHPQYLVTILPHIDDPIREFEILRERDPFFWKWSVRWSSRYLLEEHMHGILKFAQAMRVYQDANERLSPSARNELIKYLRKNHPGYDRAATQARHEGAMEDEDDE